MRGLLCNSLIIKNVQVCCRAVIWLFYLVQSLFYGHKQLFGVGIPTSGLLL